MPKKMEEALKRAARAKGFEPDSDRYRRYVYGTLQKIKEGQHKDGRKD